MAKYIFDQYELVRHKWEVEADSLEEAIQKFEESDMEDVEGSDSFVEIADRYGYNCGIRCVELPNGTSVWHNMLETASQTKGGINRLEKELTIDEG